MPELIVLLIALSEPTLAAWLLFLSETEAYGTTFAYP